MRIAASLISVGAAAVVAGCVSSSGATEPRGATKARYTGAVLVVFTNATPDRMCGFYMIEDREEEYGDNWLPDAGVPSGGSVQFRVRPGKYKARWDTCKQGKDRPYFAATLWREAAVTVKRETQLYAYITDSVAPTKRAAVMGRDYNIVRFPGQAIDPDPKPQPPQSQQVALRAASEPPQIAGFIGRVMLSAEQVAERDAEPEVPAESFNAREFVDGRARAPAKPTQVKPSLNRKHDLSSSGIEYRKR
jgi:hypothetical protein